MWFCIRQVFDANNEDITMTKEFLVIIDSVVMERVYFAADGSIDCYQHPDLVAAYAAECASAVPSDEDQALFG